MRVPEMRSMTEEPQNFTVWNTQKWLKCVRVPTASVNVVIVLVSTTTKDWSLTMITLPAK
jgi:regulation of enolase protein 1 (concanavalin A-like superfamily)